MERSMPVTGLPSEMIKLHPNGWSSRKQAGEHVTAIIRSPRRSTLPLFNLAPEILGARFTPRQNIVLNALIKQRTCETICSIRGKSDNQTNWVARHGTATARDPAGNQPERPAP